MNLRNAAIQQLKREGGVFDEIGVIATQAVADGWDGVDTPETSEHFDGFATGQPPRLALISVCDQGEQSRFCFTTWKIDQVSRSHVRIALRCKLLDGHREETNRLLLRKTGMDVVEGSSHLHVMPGQRFCRRRCLQEPRVHCRKEDCELLAGDAIRGIVLCDPNHFPWDPSAPTPSPCKQAFRWGPSLGQREPFGCRGITSAGACNRSTTVECRFRRSRPKARKAIRPRRQQRGRVLNHSKNPPNSVAVAVAAD